MKQVHLYWLWNSPIGDNKPVGLYSDPTKGYSQCGQKIPLTDLTPNLGETTCEICKAKAREAA